MARSAHFPDWRADGIIAPVITSPSARRARIGVMRTALALAALAVALLAAGCQRTPVVPPGPGGAELLADDFSDPAAHQWDIFTDDPDLSAEQVNGQLQLTVNTPDERTWSVLQDDVAVYEDLALEVDASAVAGPTDNSYGLVFRYADRFNYYAFDISSDGWYQLLVRQGSSEEDAALRKLVDWTQSDQIRTGLNQINRVGVVARGNQISVLINGQTVNQVTDATHARGRVGVIAGSFGETGVQVAFDNLVVRMP